MSIWGKVLGTLFGFMFGRLPGAILGFIVGHMFDKGYSQDFNQLGGFGRFFTSSEAVKSQAIFFHALFSVLGHIAKADGRVTEEEIKVASDLMDQMNLTGDTRREAQQAFREGKAADFPLKGILKQFSESCYGRKDILQMYLEILIQAACADGVVDKDEMRVLDEVAKHLGFKQHHLRFLISSFEAETRFRRAWKNASQRSNQRTSSSSSSGSSSQSSSSSSSNWSSRSSHSSSSQSSSRSSNSSSWQHRQRSHSHSHQQQREPQYTQQQSIADAFRILGVKESDDAKTIKRAYRKLMSEHHPDKLVSKGLPKQAMELAKQKTQDIQAAYESVRKHKSF
ncbi:co-chaperone DjlA [Paraneptunicella aestuarii]|uniref:co-chaperone DjlA n=1 Tax=Paraneptunicella aestuarii TaxID=2831148 RepID=UPI001E423292|nr:co-chaperone DjlA [Paraneptunicella aestuarii]UAA39556.1 co-chaperone DjlA [Paraneptunicella aestuarii]